MELTFRLNRNGVASLDNAEVMLEDRVEFEKCEFVKPPPPPKSTANATKKEKDGDTPPPTESDENAAKDSSKDEEAKPKSEEESTKGEQGSDQSDSGKEQDQDGKSDEVKRDGAADEPQVDVTAENAAFLEALHAIQQAPDHAITEINTDGSDGISFVEWQMAGQRFFKKALVVTVRPARASRFISSYEFSQAFHDADGDKDKLITEDEMVILCEKVYAAAQQFIDAPEAEPFTDFKVNVSTSNGTNVTASKPEKVCKMVVEKRIRRVRLDIELLPGDLPALSEAKIKESRAALTSWDSKEKAARERAEALNSFEAYMLVLLLLLLLLLPPPPPPPPPNIGSAGT